MGSNLERAGSSINPVDSFDLEFEMRANQFEQRLRPPMTAIGELTGGGDIFVMSFFGYIAELLY